VHVVADGTSSMKVHDRIIGLEVCCRTTLTPLLAPFSAVPHFAQRMRQAGAWITSCQSIMFQLLEDASHPKFREISAIAKESQPECGISHL